MCVGVKIGVNQAVSGDLMMASGMAATAVAALTGYSAYWIGHIARRYNTDGPDGVCDRRHTLCTGQPDLPTSQLAELGAAVACPHSDGDRWCRRTVAQWLTERLGHRVIPCRVTPL